MKPNIHEFRKKRKEHVRAIKKKAKQTVRGLEVEVPIMDQEVLVSRAVADFELRVGSPIKRASQALIARICVNYLRHNCSEYDDHMDELDKVDCLLMEDRLAKYRMRKKILKRIAMHYPFLEDECNRQVRRVDLQRFVDAK